MNEETSFIRCEIDNGEENDPIYVTGSHLVYDPMIKDYVRVDNLRANIHHVYRRIVALSSTV